MQGRRLSPFYTDEETVRANTADSNDSASLVPFAPLGDFF